MQTCRQGNAHMQHRLHCRAHALNPRNDAHESSSRVSSAAIFTLWPGHRMTAEGWGAQDMWRIDTYSPLKAHCLGHLGSDGALEALEGLQAVSVAHAAGCQGLCHDSCPLLGALGCHRQLQVAGGSRGLAGKRGRCIGKAVPQICGDLHACAMCQKYSPGNDLALNLEGRHQQPLYSNSKAGTTEPHASHVAVIMHRSGSSTVDDLYDWADLIQAGQRPGGGVGGGLGRGAVCQKVAAVKAGAEVVLCHLQRYAHMQVAALSIMRVALALLAAMRTASEPRLQRLTSSSVLRAHRPRRRQGWLLGCLNSLFYPHLRPQGPDVQLCDIASSFTAVSRASLHLRNVVGRRVSDVCCCGRHGPSTDSMAGTEKQQRQGEEAPAQKR